MVGDERGPQRQRGGLAPGGGVEAHVNAERDVLWVVVEGEGEALLDGRAHGLAPGRAVLVPRGCERSVRAGAAGLRYVSAHLRRAGAIAPR